MSAINTLKNELGKALGTRKNKYLIEIPMPTIDGRTLNILCNSASFPTRNIPNAELWHMGRKYNVRGTHDFEGTYDVNFIEDDGVNIRRMFDGWMKAIDDPNRPVNPGIVGGVLNEINPAILDNISDAVQVGNVLDQALENPRQIVDFFLGAISEDSDVPNYQTDINIWQLSGSQDMLYGYKLQNVFPGTISEMEFSDSEADSLSEFTVTFIYSDFIPIYGTNNQIINTLLGEEVSAITSGINTIL